MATCSTAAASSSPPFPAREVDPKSKPKNVDLDVDLKLGAVAGYYGEALRSVDVKLSRRNGAIKAFALNGKLGRDTPLIGRFARPTQGREVIYLETNDAGAFFRFTDTYSKMVGGQLHWRWIRRPWSRAPKRA